MAIEIAVGPPYITIHRSRVAMITDNRGEIDRQRAQGVFAEDTRFVSTYRMLINGEAWQRVSSAAVSYHTALFFLVNPALEAGDLGVITLPSKYESERAFRRGGPAPSIPCSALGLSVRRSVNQGIDETFEITNYGRDEVSVVFEIELDSDFADLFEVKVGSIKQRENLVTHWDVKRLELSTRYRNEDYLRHFVYRVVDVDSAPTYANGRLLYPVHLGPHKSWKARTQMILQHKNGAREYPARPTRSRRTNHADKLHERWLDIRTRIRTPNAELQDVFRQSVIDLGALRLLEWDIGPDAWVPAAGVPWYVTLFGRDSLITSLQSLMCRARFAEGTLRTLARYQASERDDWRDAQPGKIMHEIRYGELAYFNFVPQTPYYGTWDATPLYLMLLHEAWLWLADLNLVKDLLPTAERCLQWIDEYGDLDGDGFQEYRTFSPKGFENMSWKDASEAVVYPDGTQVKQPKALCELQGYVYAAKKGMAEIFTALGQHDRAKGLEAQARELKRRFNQAFWMEDEGTYAFGLDPEKRQIKSIASNAGHCLWTGIAEGDKAARVVQRLLAPDMWSGWGVRTLSSKNPAYDPHSYQRGAIWPHDNGIIALGMKRSGFSDQACQIARGILDAAVRFEGFRLPEVFSGLDREETVFPVQYRGANTPQAWAAGSIFHLVRAILGLRADAPKRCLYVNPTLPDWLPTLELRNMQIGDTRVDLSFWREGDKSHFAVSGERGGHIEVRADSLTGVQSR